MLISSVFLTSLMNVPQWHFLNWQLQVVVAISIKLVSNWCSVPIIFIFPSQILYRQSWFSLPSSKPVVCSVMMYKEILSLSYTHMANVLKHEIISLKSWLIVADVGEINIMDSLTLGPGYPNCTQVILDKYLTVCLQ